MGVVGSQFKKKKEIPSYGRGGGGGGGGGGGVFAVKKKIRHGFKSRG